MREPNRSNAVPKREASPTGRGPQLVQDGPVCEQTYPLVAPGVYCGEVLSTTCHWDRRFGRWVVSLKFRIVAIEPPSEPGGDEIYCLMNAGCGPTPRAGRRSHYWRYWTIANGGPPHRRQRMTSKVFLRRLFEIRVGTVESDFLQRPQIAEYSIVREILRRLP
jgi:hypothetical protein